MSCLDVWFMCWAAAAWWAAVRVSRAVLVRQVRRMTRRNQKILKI